MPDRRFGAIRASPVRLQLGSSADPGKLFQRAPGFESQLWAVAGGYPPVPFPSLLVPYPTLPLPYPLIGH
jgi:hypothetical protein